MRGVLTIARHTFAQALRMKVAGAFILLLAVTLAAMPFMMEGDGMLAGRIKTFLSYSVGVTAALLSLVTIFVATSVIASDVRGKQVFTVVTKPLARWQYVLGRWVGVVALDAVLLGAAGASIYALAQHLRSGPAGPADRQAVVQEAADPRASDRRTVETEIFTARIRVAPDPFGKKLQGRVERRIGAMKERQEYDSNVEAYQRQLGCDDAGAREALEEEVRKQERLAIQTAKPRKNIAWTFSDVRVAGTSTSGKAHLTGRRGDLMRFEAPSALVGLLVYRGPVRVANVDATAVYIGANHFVVQVNIEDLKHRSLATLALGEQADIEIDPTVQLAYKPKASGKVKGGQLARILHVRNPLDGFGLSIPRKDAVGAPTTVTVSARVVSDQGQTWASYANLAPTSVTILHEDVSLLYRVGGFGPNLLRGMLLVMCQLAFLAGLGVLAGTFLSFPVACLMCFGALPFSIGREFLVQSAVWSKSDFLGVVSGWIISAMSMLLPDFAATSPGDSLVEGMYIAWSSVGRTAALVVLLQTGLLLAPACLIFHRRELARVQM